MGEFQHTGITNLVRRQPGGVFYWQAKIGGRTRRGSLRTTDRRKARKLLAVAIERARAGDGTRASRPGTLAEALEKWLEQQERRPELKRATVREYRKRAQSLKAELGGDRALRSLTADDLGAWWSRYAGRVSASTANGSLHVLRCCFAVVGVPSGILADLRRQRLVRRHLEVPTMDELRCIVGSIRKAGAGRFGEESGDFVEWLAFSGLRVAEAAALQWEDVRESFLVVRGGPEGTKNRRTRSVPIIPHLQGLIDRRRPKGAAGPVFSIKSPSGALVAACRREGVRRLRVHDLRHLFATACLQSGVDAPTVAAWLGHSDGGALLLRTYAHVMDDHAAESARRVHFR